MNKRSISINPIKFKCQKFKIPAAFFCNHCIQTFKQMSMLTLQFTMNNIQFTFDIRILNIAIE